MHGRGGATPAVPVPPESGRARGYARFASSRPWLVVGAWIGIAIVLNLAVPQLEVIAGRDSSPMVPETAPSAQAASTMDRAFGSGKGESAVVVAMERTSGLTARDRVFAESLVGSLSVHPADVASVQNIRDPALRRALTSKDGEARYLIVGITGATGAPSSLRQVELVREIVRRDAPAGLTVSVTGPTATVTDVTTATERSVVRITVVSILLIALILFLVYRSVAIPLLILAVVGIGLGLGRAVVAWCGMENVFAVSTFSGSFLTAVVLGAGTDYAVFLVARYHEMRRQGLPPDVAAALAATRVGPVVAGSAVTVILGTLSMALAHIGFFTTTGPAVAVSIAVNLLVGLTFTPAVLVLAGRRGWAEPRAISTAGVWKRTGRLVAAHPARIAAITLAPLVALAGLVPLTSLSYDFREPLPVKAESNQGYALLARHFPVNEVLPDYVVIKADHDLRTSAGLAVIERAAAAVAQYPGVDLVRTVTRPAGTLIAQASLARQSGRIGTQLARAGGQVGDGASGTSRLAVGALRVHDGADQLANGAGTAAAGASEIASASGQLSDGMGRLLDASERIASGGGQLHAGAGALADGLDAAGDQVDVAVQALGQVHAALASQSLTCGLDPVCKRAREGLEQIWKAERDQLLPGLRQAADGARALDKGSGQLSVALTKLRGGLAQARSGTRRLAQGQDLFAAKLGDLADGADLLAQGTGKVGEGVQQVSATLPDLEKGLVKAAEVLRTTKRALGAEPLASGFYLPPSSLRTQDFREAGRLFISEDGKVVRLAVLGATDAFGPAASARSRAMREVVRNSFRGTALEDSEVAVTGISATNDDLRGYVGSDLRIIALGSLAAVLLVLLLLLRSVVASVVLVATVVLSWASAMGLATLIWQYALGTPLDWTVAAVSLVILVAVGADYNLLLAKRMREEAPEGSPDGIARASAATGGVITTAGVIFAASMLAMLAGRVTTVGQAGSTIAIGLLVDTFVVRSLLVPALATLLGKWFWWPRRMSAADR